jgi:hypothetical protein
VNGLSTLSGALSGTSATFSNLVSIAAFSTSDLSSSPQLSLTRSASQFTGIAIRGAVAADRALFSVPNDDALYIGRHPGGGGAWTKQVAFLDNGNVGIGTTSPTALLNTYSATTATQIIVTGADTTNQRLEVTDGTVTNRFGIFGRTNGDVGTIGTQTNHALVFNTNNTERMRITSGGNVGIGTTSPVANDGTSKTLQIGDRLVIQNVIGTQLSLGTNVYYDGTWKYIAAAKAQAIRCTGQSGAIQFSLSPTGTIGGTVTNMDGSDVKMIILDTGNVGIGTASPNFTASGRIVCDINGSSSSGLSLSAGGTSYGFLYANSSNYIIGTGASSASIPISFETAGSERMRITSGGNVGIGTTSPGYDGSGYGAIRYLTQYNASGTSHELAGSSTANDAFMGSIDFINAANTGAPGAGRYGVAWIRGYTTNASATSTGGGYLSFGAKADGGSSSEKMRITSGGAVCVNATAVSSQGEIFNATASNLAAMFKTTGGAANNWAANFWNNGTSGNNIFIEFGTETSYNGRGSVTYNRGSGLTVYNTTSDYRLKSEIQDFNALEIIGNLNPKEFRIGDAEYKAIGFIAHELQEFYPQAVHGEKDEVDEKGNPKYQGVDYSQLTGLLTKAIQEQQLQIEALKLLIK